MSNHLLFFKAFERKKRVRNEVSESLTRLECVSLKDLESILQHAELVSIARYGPFSVTIWCFVIGFGKIYH